MWHVLSEASGQPGGGQEVLGDPFIPAHLPLLVVIRDGEGAGALLRRPKERPSVRLRAACG